MEDIFNSNKKLEELLFYALDWGLFLRSDAKDQLTPFLMLQNEDKISFRVMVTDEYPLEYAKSILAKEVDPYQQFAVGFEGYLNDDEGNRTDAIIVQGFDIAQDKGTVLGQMFNPKENGGFYKIDKITFLGNPNLIIDKQINSDSRHNTPELLFNVTARERNNFVSHTIEISYPNPSIIGNTIKNFLRSKLTTDNPFQLSGNFDINILKEKEINADFLKFVVINSITETLKSEFVDEWLQTYRRDIEIICKYDDEIILEARKKPRKEVFPDIDVSVVSSKKWWEFWK